MRTKVNHDRVEQANRGVIYSERHGARTRAEIRLGSRSVAMEAGPEHRTYPARAVEIKRYDGNTFELILGGEHMFFESDEPIKLTFDFIPALDALRRRRRFRERPGAEATVTVRTDRPLPTPSRPVETKPTPSEQRQEAWTELAIGHQHAELIEAVIESAKREQPHQHRWEAAPDRDVTVRMCTECRQVLIDLSDSADETITIDG